MPPKRITTNDNRNRSNGGAGPVSSLNTVSAKRTTNNSTTNNNNGNSISSSSTTLPRSSYPSVTSNHTSNTTTITNHSVNPLAITMANFAIAQNNRVTGTTTLHNTVIPQSTTVSSSSSSQPTVTSTIIPTHPSSSSTTKEQSITHTLSSLPNGISSSSSSSSHVRVAVRVRPLNRTELQNNSACCIGILNNTITLVDPVSLEMSNAYGGNLASLTAVSTSSPSSSDPVSLALSIPRRIFTFDHTYARAGQEKIYNDIGIYALDHIWKGYNTSIFAYGQTGSGKSYTMMGVGGVLDPGNTGNDIGIIPRLCANLFDRIAKAENDAADAVDEWTDKAQQKVLRTVQKLKRQRNDNERGTTDKFKKKEGGVVSTKKSLQTTFDGLTTTNNATETKNIVTIDLNRLEHDSNDNDDLTSSDEESTNQTLNTTHSSSTTKSTSGTHSTFTVTASYLEIYCERVRDLFALEDAAAVINSPNSTATLNGTKKLSSSNTNPHAFDNSHTHAQQTPLGNAGHLRVREHPTKGAYVEGLREIPVNNYGEIEKLLVAGSFMRTVAETRMNESSSRSHAVFTLHFKQSTVDTATGIPVNERTSKIVLVDLAGSERADAFSGRVTKAGALDLLSPRNANNNEVARMREMTKINTSLSALGAVIKALASKSENQHHHHVSSASHTNNHNFVPYRNSVLTWLLKDSLGGNSITTMIATVSPADSSYAETLSTLKYCESVKRITLAAKINNGLSAEGTSKLIAELRAEVAVLRAALASNQQNMLPNNNTNVSLNPILSSFPPPIPTVEHGINLLHQFSHTQPNDTAATDMLNKVEVLAVMPSSRMWSSNTSTLSTVDDSSHFSTGNTNSVNNNSNSNVPSVDDLYSLAQDVMSKSGIHSITLTASTNGSSSMIGNSTTTTSGQGNDKVQTVRKPPKIGTRLPFGTPSHALLNASGISSPPFHMEGGNDHSLSTSFVSRNYSSVSKALLTNPVMTPHPNKIMGQGNNNGNGTILPPMTPGPYSLAGILGIENKQNSSLQDSAVLNTMDASTMLARLQLELRHREKLILKLLHVSNSSSHHNSHSSVTENESSTTDIVSNKGGNHSISDTINRSKNEPIILSPDEIEDDDDNDNEEENNLRYTNKGNSSNSNDTNINDDNNDHNDDDYNIQQALQMVHKTPKHDEIPSYPLSLSGGSSTNPPSLHHTPEFTIPYTTNTKSVPSSSVTNDNSASANRPLPSLTNLFRAVPSSPPPQLNLPHDDASWTKRELEETKQILKTALTHIAMSENIDAETKKLWEAHIFTDHQRDVRLNHVRTELQRLAQENHHQQQEDESLRMENFRLKTALTEAETKYTRTRTQYDNLQQTIDDIEKARNSSSSSNRTSLSPPLSPSKGSSNDRFSLQQRIDALTRTAAEATSRASAAETARLSMREEVEAASTALESAEQTIESLQETLNRREHKEIQLNGTINQLRQELQEIRSELEASKSDYTLLQGKYALDGGERAAAHAKVSEALAELSRARTDRTEIEHILQNEQQAHKNTIARYNNMVQAVQNESTLRISNLEEENMTLRKEMDSLRSSLQDNQIQISKAHHEVHDRQNQVQHYELQKTEYEYRIGQLKEEIIQLQDQSNVTKQQIQKMNEIQYSLEESKLQTESQNRTFQLQIKQLQEQLERQKGEMQEYLQSLNKHQEREKDTLCKHIETLEVQVQQTIQDHSTTKALLDLERERSHGLENNTAEALAQAETTEEMLTSLRTTVRTNELEKESLRHEIEKLKHENRLTKSSLTAVQNQYTELQHYTTTQTDRHTETVTEFETLRRTYQQLEEKYTYEQTRANTIANEIPTLRTQLEMERKGRMDDRLAFDQAIEERDKEYTQELLMVTEERNQSTEHLKEQLQFSYEQQLAQAQDQYQIKLHQLEESHHTSTHNLTQNFAKEKETLETEFYEKCTEYEETQVTLIRQHQQAIEELRLQYQDERNYFTQTQAEERSQFNLAQQQWTDEKNQLQQQWNTERNILDAEREIWNEELTKTKVLLNQYETEIRTQREQMDQLHQKLYDEQEEKIRYHNNYTEVHKQYTDTIQNHQQVMDQLHQEINELKQTREQARNRAAITQERLLQLQADYVNTKEIAAKAIQQVTIHQQQTVKLSDELTIVRTNNQQKDEILRQNAEKLDDYERTLTENQQQHQQLQQQYYTLQTDYSILQNTYETEKNSLTVEQDRLNTALTNSQNRVNRLQAQLLDLAKHAQSSLSTTKGNEKIPRLDVAMTALNAQMAVIQDGTNQLANANKDAKRSKKKTQDNNNRKLDRNKDNSERKWNDQENRTTPNERTTNSVPVYDNYSPSDNESISSVSTGITSYGNYSRCYSTISDNNNNYSSINYRRDSMVSTTSTISPPPPPPVIAPQASEPSSSRYSTPPPPPPPVVPYVASIVNDSTASWVREGKEADTMSLDDNELRLINEGEEQKMDENHPYIPAHTNNMTSSSSSLVLPPRPPSRSNSVQPPSDPTTRVIAHSAPLSIQSNRSRSSSISSSVSSTSSSISRRSILALQAEMERVRKANAEAMSEAATALASVGLPVPTILAEAAKVIAEDKEKSPFPSSSTGKPSQQQDLMSISRSSSSISSSSRPSSRRSSIPTPVPINSFGDHVSSNESKDAIENTTETKVQTTVQPSSVPSSSRASTVSTNITHSSALSVPNNPAEHLEKQLQTLLSSTAPSNIAGTTVPSLTQEDEEERAAIALQNQLSRLNDVADRLRLRSLQLEQEGKNVLTVLKKEQQEQQQKQTNGTVDTTNTLPEKTEENESTNSALPDENLTVSTTTTTSIRSPKGKGAIKTLNVYRSPTAGNSAHSLLTRNRSGFANRTINPRNRSGNAMNDNMTDPYTGQNMIGTSTSSRRESIDDPMVDENNDEENSVQGESTSINEYNTSTNGGDNLNQVLSPSSSDSSSPLSPSSQPDITRAQTWAFLLDDTTTTTNTDETTTTTVAGEIIVDNSTPLQSDTVVIDNDEKTSTTSITPPLSGPIIMSSSSSSSTVVPESTIIGTTVTTAELPTVISSGSNSSSLPVDIVNIQSTVIIPLTSDSVSSSMTENNSSSTSSVQSETIPAVSTTVNTSSSTTTVVLPAATSQHRRSVPDLSAMVSIARLDNLRQRTKKQ